MIPLYAIHLFIYDFKIIGIKLNYTYYQCFN